MRANTAASAAVLVLASFATATARSTVSRHPGHTNHVSSRTVTASPLPKFYNGTCTAETVTIRREWSSLSNEEKAAYIQAQQCAMSLPAQTTMKNVTTRFSDYQASHHAYSNTEYGDIIHYVGQFLPWHRLLIHAVEQTFREECGYIGPMVWWDEKRDADLGNFFLSDIWDPVTGFGGNGTGPDGCLTEGPFANLTEHIGPMLAYSDYCLKRIWDNEEGVTTGNSSVIDSCNAAETYDDFQNCVALGPHHGAHTAIGGLMADKDASPGDPVFYLHHSYIDRLWWQWQQADGENRLFWISGNTVNKTLHPSQIGVNATLDYVLQLKDIVPDVKAFEVMNAQGGFLCYDYDY